MSLLQLWQNDNPPEEEFPLSYESFWGSVLPPNPPIPGDGERLAVAAEFRAIR